MQQLIVQRGKGFETRFVLGIYRENDVQAIISCQQLAERLIEISGNVTPINGIQQLRGFVEQKQ